MLMYKSLLLLISLLFLGMPLHARVTQVTNSPVGENKFNVNLRSGVSFNGIVYKKQRLGDKWILIFRKSSGLRVQASAQQNVVSANDFAAAVFEMLTSISAKGQRVDEIQVDLDLVGNTLDVAAEATKDSIGSRSSILQGDAEITDSLRRAVRNSEQISMTCNGVGVHGYRCGNPTAAVDPVVFDSAFLNRGGKFLRTHPEGGLSKSMWFSINLLHQK